MQTTLRIPTGGLVQSAIAEFDDQNDVIEVALTEHFHQYPTNTNLPHVLLKVVALNCLYSTQILAVLDVARNIQRHGEEIDIGLAAGSAEVVEKIGLVTIQSTGKERYNYSFATKYCSWHRPDSYPMWDSRVDTTYGLFSNKSTSRQALARTKISGSMRDFATWWLR